MSRDLEDVLASIDGALADPEFPDAMRWSPDPASVTDAPEPWHTEEPAGSFIENVLPALLDRSRPRFYVDPEWRARLEVHTQQREGEILLVLAPDVETARRAFDQFADVARAWGVAARQAAETIGAALNALAADLRPILERNGLLPDEGPDRSEQPFERALWHKARQGTGPDRQVQHRPRPRRHLL